MRVLLECLATHLYPATVFFNPEKFRSDFKYDLPPASKDNTLSPQSQTHTTANGKKMEKTVVACLDGGKKCQPTVSR